jgi:biotin operon repressor
MQMQLSLLDARFSSEEAGIMKLLRSGRNNAISVKALAAETGMGGVEIRQTIRDLIMEHGILIGSSVGDPPGYFIPETAEEAITATRSLRHRGIMILVRAAKLQRCSVELVFNQARLEFEEVSK